MEDIYASCGDILAIHDSNELVIKAKILAKTTIGLIQTLQEEAENHTDSNIQVSFDIKSLNEQNAENNGY